MRLVLVKRIQLTMPTEPQRVKGNILSQRPAQAKPAGRRYVLGSALKGPGKPFKKETTEGILEGQGRVQYGEELQASEESWEA